MELADVILGDVIVGLNGHPVESDTQLMDLLELEPPETLLAFDVLRDGKLIRIVLRSGEQPPRPPARPVKPEPGPASPTRPCPSRPSAHPAFRCRGAPAECGPKARRRYFFAGTWISGVAPLLVMIRLPFSPT